MKRQRSSKEKAKIALEAVKEESTIVEIGNEYSIHPNQVGRLKKQLLENADEIFSKKQKNTEKSLKKDMEELYKQIGQLKVENDFLKKKLNWI